jgi:hypothetical protein
MTDAAVSAALGVGVSPDEDDERTPRNEEWGQSPIPKKKVPDL